jgi:choice-of-anchor B domain-containing protein
MIFKSRGFSIAAILIFAMCLFVALVWAGQSTLSAQDEGPVVDAPMNRVMEAMLENPPDVQNLDAMAFTECVGGMAGSYPCEKVDLISFTPIGNVGGSTGADAWGWTDPLDGKEYAIMNRQNGTGFLDITDPENPIYLGNLPTTTGVTSWRDAKVYQNHAYIVSDGNGAHGMQVFDLTRLRTVVSPPVTFTETNHYNNLGSAHNIVINEDSGYAYAVGVSSGAQTCSSGLHIIDLSDPPNPSFVGCHSASGYSHDSQCVNYAGPDPDHQGDEICFNYGGNSGIFVIDVTNKAATQQLSFTSYPQQDYTHQGWLTADHRYIVMNDELDEISFGINTRTRVFDVSDLDSPPVQVATFNAPVPSTDHNLYVKDEFSYEANYQSGFRILNIGDAANDNVFQAAYFDTYTPNNNNGFSGAWTAYPYFDSGNVIVNSRGEGLFIVRPRLFEISKSEPVGSADVGGTLTYEITVTNTALVTATGVVVTDTLNGVDTVLSGPSSIAAGASATYEFEYTITEDDCDTTLSNTASVSASDFISRETLEAVETDVDCDEEVTYYNYLPFAAKAD